MALSFPSSPTSGQQYTGPNGVVYEWDNTVGVWNKVNAVQTVLSGSSAATSAARIPSGTTGQRPTATLATGQFRYNTTIPQLEYSDGTSWLAVGSGLSAATLAQAQAGTLTTVAATPETAVPKNASGMTGSAYLPAGTTAQQPTASNYTGQLRYNTTRALLEFSNGTAWFSLAGSAASSAQAAAGVLSTVYSSPETAVPKDASGMTGSAFIPSGTTTQQPAANSYTGQLRYNTTVPQWEYSNGTSWLALVTAGVAGVTSFDAGTTGFTPSAATTGVVTLAGTLNVANGGTGATTATAAITALLPTQTANSGKYLTTDGTVASWATVSSGGAAATLAEAAAGTLNTVFSSPQTSVPKDASGMTGAALMPGGTDAQKAAITGLVAGMLRYNNQAGTSAGTYMEWYNGASWSSTFGSGAGDWQTFTASGTWTKPSSGTMAWVFVWGGGAGGNNGNSGGGGGGCTPAFLQLSTLAATVSVTVGGGGTSGVVGGAGGTSYFGTIGALGGGVTCQGADSEGPGTVPPFYSSQCAATNTSSGTNVWTPFSGGQGAVSGNNDSGGSSYWGGGGGGSDQLQGRSVMGGSGATQFTAAVAPGGGGYGGFSGSNDGARGQVTVIVL